MNIVIPQKHQEGGAKAAYKMGHAHGYRRQKKIDAEKSFGIHADAYHDGYRAGESAEEGEAWREKRGAALKGRHYHEQTGENVDKLSTPKLDAYLAGITLTESEELNKVAKDNSDRRQAHQLEIGDVVEITGNVNFKGQTGEITRFGKEKKFVVVKLYNGGEHSFHSSDVSEADLSHEEHDEDEGEKNKFYVAFYDNAEERSWIGVVTKEAGGKWHEKTFKGKPEIRWGQTYMSYLTPDDIMSWIHKDYHRGIEIEGPFFSASEAQEHVKQNWGRIDEATKNKFEIVRNDGTVVEGGFFSKAAAEKQCIEWMEEAEKEGLPHSYKVRPQKAVKENKSEQKAGWYVVAKNDGEVDEGATFTKRTRMMEPDVAVEKAKKIRALLSSGDGFAQVERDGDKAFLLVKANTELKDKITKILEGFKKVNPKSQERVSYDREGQRVKTPDGEGVVKAEYKEPTFSQMVPFARTVSVQLDGSDKTKSYRLNAVRFIKDKKPVTESAGSDMLAKANKLKADGQTKAYHRAMTTYCEYMEEAMRFNGDLSRAKFYKQEGEKHWAEWKKLKESKDDDKKDNVIRGKFGKKPEEKKPEVKVVQQMKKVSLLDAFGSEELAALEKEGIKLIEKPSYWTDMNKRNTVDEVKLKRIEKVLGKKFKEYEGWEIYATKHDDDMPKGPLATVENMPKEDMFIVNFGDGSERYLCDKTGARTYIRFWAKILPGVKESVFTNYADWKQSVMLSHPTKNIKFRGKMEGEKTTVIASVPGEDAVYGIWDDAIESGEIITEGVANYMVVGNRGGGRGQEIYGNELYTIERARSIVKRLEKEQSKPSFGPVNRMAWRIQRVDDSTNLIGGAEYTRQDLLDEYRKKKQKKVQD